MMPLHVLLVALGLLLEASQTAGRWTYNLRCHDCSTINNFHCPEIRTCVYEVRRCLTVSIRLSPREILVYKNCTSNCTFLYPFQVPPEAPRVVRTSNFYWVRCCNVMTCNEGGPSLERDIFPSEAIEEDVEGTVPLGESTFLLSVASLLVSTALT